ncbi:MAG: hypothetical protein Roseis2KO_31270 [Roseivirga sp.]
MKKIFISHSSKDSNLVKQFVDKILILGLQVSRKQIFCTSLDGTGIRSGNDFKDSIKQAIEDSSVAILIVTQNYKESEVCLNEMGALWVLCENTIPFILKPIDYDKIGFIHSTSQVLRLGSKDDLLKLIDDHPYLNQGDYLNVANYSNQIDQFLRISKPKPRAIFKQRITDNKPTEEDFEGYFNRFFDPEINITNHLIKAQPSLEDCVKVFTEKYARTIFSFYSQLYTQGIDYNTQFEMAGLDRFSYKTASYSDVKNDNYSLTKGMTFLLEKDAIRPGNDYYMIRFNNHDNSDGFSLKVWCFLNGRWVFFSKIFDVVDLIDEVTNDSNIQAMIKYSSKLGLGKELADSTFGVIAISHITSELIRKNKK